MHRVFVGGPTVLPVTGNPLLTIIRGGILMLMEITPRERGPSSPADTATGMAIATSANGTRVDHFD
jgi:hypothetical protein